MNIVGDVAGACAIGVHPLAVRCCLGEAPAINTQAYSTQDNREHQPNCGKSEGQLRCDRSTVTRYASPTQSANC